MLGILECQMIGSDQLKVIKTVLVLISNALSRLISVD